jgi:N-methylhydantoinase A/oxoprolinase/acetone carboxylase beta subunit
MQNSSRIGVDIGGTFTDFVLEHDGAQTYLKLLTTPDAPEVAVLSGIRQLLDEAQLAASQVAMVVHGTTLATNAVIERRGAKIAFITTEGFRDTLEMAYEHRYDQYDLLVGKPLPLVPRELRFPVLERVAADGRVLRPLDREAVARIADRLAEQKVDAVAIGFLHAYVNPDHERDAAEILKAALPGARISLSSDVSPEIREYERFCTVTANAYVQPLMAGYLGSLESELRALGIGGPLMLMQSNGGLCDVATAMRYPVRLLESGPAGGAVFAASLARELNIAEALLLDIGGTTAKLCFVDDGQPQSARGLEVARIDRFKPGSGLPLRFPVVELCEIGAGGGSIAGVDRLGRLTVGPQSAGSVPGPACYGGGGSKPTVTDAHLVLGRLDPDCFAAGTVALDSGAARDVVRDHVAAPLSLNVEQGSVGIIEIINENMASAAREHAIEVGRGLAGRTLIAIGGAASLHAADLAAKLQIDRVLVPVAAGVGSAAGFLRAPLAFEKSRSQHQLLSRYSQKNAQAVIDGLLEEATGILRPLAQTMQIASSLTAQMRYCGQGYEITVPLDLVALRRDGEAHLRAAFESHYRHLYGRVLPGKDVEILGWTARAEVVLKKAASANTRQSNAARGQRNWSMTEQVGGRVTGHAFDRDALEVGQEVAGPALIIDTGTTLMVPTGFSARVVSAGHLLLERNVVEVVESAA